MILYKYMDNDDFEDCVRARAEWKWCLHEITAREQLDAAMLAGRSVEA